MPYRALLWTIMTVALALLAVGMWVSAIRPSVAIVDADAASQPARAVEPAPGATTQRGETSADFSRKLHRVVPMTALLSFVLICMLLIVGMAGALREWVRFRTTGPGRVRKKPAKTKYVDAWKIAGERMSSEGRDDGEGKRD
jgi:hypothetical protein